MSGSEGDYGLCPYLLRFYGVVGHDPEAVCIDGHCGHLPMPEPECVTCEPADGWPSLWENGTYKEPS